MGDLSKKAEQGVEGKEVMRLLFGDQFGDLAEDGFEGSKEEYQIFEEIFYRTSVDDAKTDKDTHPKPPVTINPGGSVQISSCSMKDSSEKAYETAELNFKETSAFGSFQGSSSGVGSSAHNALVKRAELSPTKHPDQEKENPGPNSPGTCTNLACLHPSKVVLDVPMKDSFFEPVSSTVHLDQEKCPEHSYSDPSSDLLKMSKFVSDMPESDQEPVPCRVIETLERGILSTCNLFNRQGDMDAAGYIDGGLVLNYKCRAQQIEKIKVGVEGKSVTSPVSQESVSSALLATSEHLAPKEASGAIMCAKQSAEEPKNVDIVDAAVKLKRPLKRELPCRLESYAHRLLIDAGWKIEPRQRNDRTRAAYFFINTEERLRSKALTVAWKACGEILLASALDSELDENGREWWDVDSFWRDMTDTMDYIDKEAHHQESSATLLHRWQLLDPFMAIVWIDKKLGTLRAGKGLKAIRSTTSILGDRRKMISTEMDVNRTDKNAGESSCLSRSLNQSILQAHQNPEVIDLQNRNILAQADCCEDLQKKDVKNLARCIDKGLHNVECLNMGSTSLGSRRKRSNRTSSKSTFMQRNSQFTNSGPNENKNLLGMEETSSLGADDSCGQINMQSQAQCPADQASQREEDIVSITGNYLICTSVYPGSSSPPQEGATISGKTVGSETTKSKSKRTAAATTDGSAKKVRKKSKKISEIGATKEISKGTKTEFHDGNCRAEVALSMDDKTDEQLDLVCHQKETDSLISEMSPECLQQGELLEKPMRSVHRTSLFEDMNVPENIKNHKKPVKSEAKAARQSGKKKGDLIMPLEDEQGNALSEADIEHKSTESEFKARRFTSNESNSMSSKKHKAVPDFNMACDQPIDLKVTVLGDNVNVPKESNCEDLRNEVLSTTSGMAPKPGSNQKLVKAKKSGVNKKKGQKKFSICRINDDDLLIAAFIKKKNFGSCSKQFPPRVGCSQLKALRKHKSQKGSSKLLPRALKKGGNHSLDGGRITLMTRTVLCWLIEMGALSLKDVLQYRNPKSNAVVKDGWVTREGILCQCCSEIFSISEFKAHAGLKQQKPSLNLFMQSGKPYTLCQLQAWSAELKKRKSNLRVMGADEKDENDDTCGLCGDGGDLLCCDNCPSTYHQTCLCVQELPEGNWYCANCICVMCRDLADGKETLGPSAVLECAQCEHKYHSVCITQKVTHDVEKGSNAWFCGESCQEVYLGLRCRVGVVNYIDDAFSWTILRCSHEDKKVCSAQKIALMVECNTKLAIALNLMEECFLPMVDPRTGIDMIPHVLYNLGSSFTRLNYQGFYAVVLEKGDKLISVASIRVHGARVAEMPLIATCSDHRRQGMCRRLLNAVEKMLITLKVKILVLSAIPSLVETWTSGFGFKPVGDGEKQQLTNVNLMLFPGTTLLTKDLHETSSAQESVENNDFYSREQQPHIGGDLMESANTLTAYQPSEDLGSDLDAKSLLPMTQVEQVGIQQRDTLMASSENCVLTARHSEHGVVSNAESCLRLTSSNINVIDQDFSTVVASQKPVANISAVVYSCSGLFASTATKNKLPSSPNHTTHDVIIRDMEAQNIKILTEDNAAEAMNGEGTVPSEGDEVAKKIVVVLQDKNDAILSDEQAGKGPSATAHEEVPNDLSSNKTTAVFIRNVEENTSQNVNTFTESSAPNTMNERKISILGDEVERGSPADASLGNDGTCVSDELAVRSANLAASNLRGISNGEVSGDDASRASKDERCDFVGRHAIAKRCTAESVEA